MPILSADDSANFRLVVENVFMPPKLPQKDPGEQIEQRMNVALCDNLIEAAREFSQDVPASQLPLWAHMIKMMESARRVANVPLEEAVLQRVFSNMVIGGMSYSSLFVLPSSGLFFIRRILYAYTCTKCRSHCTQALPWRLHSVRGIRGLATECRSNDDRGKASVLLPRSCNSGPLEYIHG